MGINAKKGYNVIISFQNLLTLKIKLKKAKVLSVNNNIIKVKTSDDKTYSFFKENGEITKTKKDASVNRLYKVCVFKDLKSFKKSTIANSSKKKMKKEIVNSLNNLDYIQIKKINDFIKKI